MTSHERNDITHRPVHSECRDIFLDRGELERLIDAEAAQNTRGGQPYQQPRTGGETADHGR